MILLLLEQLVLLVVTLLLRLLQLPLLLLVKLLTQLFEVRDALLRLEGHVVRLLQRLERDQEEDVARLLALAKPLLDPLKSFVQTDADAGQDFLLRDLDRLGVSLLTKSVQFRLGQADQFGDEVGRAFDVDVLVGGAGRDASVQVVAFAVVVLKKLKSKVFC